jgi:hypothetical protein
VTETYSGLVGELDVAFWSPEEFGRVALAWLSEGVAALAGDISDEILAGPPMKLPLDEEYTEDRPGTPWPDRWGIVGISYPSRSGGHYYKPYSQVSLKRLDALAATLTKADVTLGRSAGDEPPALRLEVRREGRGSGYARLLIMLGDRACCAAGDPKVVFLRDFAWRFTAGFGHVSPDPGGKTELELALNRLLEDSFAELGRYLRGYSWITVVAAALADRLGGVSALRGSGAFEQVAELAGGSVWLQAAPRWSDYTQLRVERVFEVLAPVLPPGMPRATDIVRPAGAGIPEISIPYVLSTRDAAEFHREGC